MKRLKFIWDGRFEYYECYNKKNERLGCIFFYKSWKCWVWEQGITKSGKIIMSRECLQEVIDKIKELENDKNKQM